MREARAAVLIRHAVLEGTNTSAAEAELFGHFGSISGSRHRRRDAIFPIVLGVVQKPGAASEEERGAEKGK